MKINKKNDMLFIRLYENTFWNADGNKEDNLKTFKVFLKDYIDRLKGLVESDFDKLSDKDFYKALNCVYDIRLDSDDYLYMLSRNNNKRYSSYNTIPTAMVFKSIKSEGHGRDFSYWEQFYQVYYDVAVGAGFKLQRDKVYSKEEIEKLVEDKSIVLMKRRVHELDNNSEFVREEPVLFPTLEIDIREYSGDESKFVQDNYNLFGQLLRKRFTKERVLNDIKEILEDFDCDLNDVFEKKSSDDPSYSNLAVACKDWYDSSKEKNEYQGIQKRLSIK